MKSGVTVFGANYSVYTRIVQLTLEEKGVPYRFVEVDVFAVGGPPADYLERHPFGRIPAFEHDGFRLFETTAITRYIDDTFDGPALVPKDSRGRARMDQITGLLDSYAYRAMVWDVFVERVEVPREGGTSDESKIAAGLQTAETCLLTLEDLMAGSDHLVGSGLTLADLHAAPMIAYFRKAPEGAKAVSGHPSVARWWERVSRRPSLQPLAE